MVLFRDGENKVLTLTLLILLLRLSNEILIYSADEVKGVEYDRIENEV